MSPSTVLVTTQERVTTITLNRPDKCNALDGAMVQQLSDVFFTASRDEQTQVVLFKGAGKHFCAGADIEWMDKLAHSSFELSRDDARSLASLLHQLYSFPKPLITLAQGSTLGGGLGLLACSDLVVAAEDASFCFSEVKIGLVPAVISPYIVSILGQHAARYYFLTAERFMAAEALRLGLVHQVARPDELATVGQSLAKTLLQHSPAAVTAVKKILSLVSNQAISLELSEKTAEIFAQMRVSKQAQEGLKAFMDKRPPRWGEEL